MAKINFSSQSFPQWTAWLILAFALQVTGCGTDQGGKKSNSSSTLVFLDDRLTECVEEAVQNSETANRAEDLTSLDCSMQNISDISDIGSLSALTSINLDRNNLISITALGDIVGLRTISSRFNDISRTPDFADSTVVSLDLGYNKISDATLLAAVTTLTSLNLEHNLLTSVDAFTGVSTLQELVLAKNGSVNCSSYTSLVANLGANADGQSVVSPSTPDVGIDCYDDSSRSLQ